MNEETLALLRKTIPNQIAADICSVQSMESVSLEDLKAACLWLENSRLSRGVHPVTEQPLTEEEKNGLFRRTKDR